MLINGSIVSLQFKETFSNCNIVCLKKTTRFEKRLVNKKNKFVKKKEEESIEVR